MKKLLLLTAIIFSSRFSFAQREAAAAAALTDDELKEATILKGIIQKVDVYTVVLVSTLSDGTQVAKEYDLGRDRAFENGVFIGEKAMIELVFEENKQDLSSQLEKFNSVYAGRTLSEILK